ncbi:hypothetical protein ACF0H5_014092 [Mactra antiquata]
MSSNPALGHLYHDDSISNALTLLDVKEKMRTRVINARESKCLDTFTKSLDTAKEICKRRNDWEQRDLRRQLNAIEWKTPSLTRSLRIESERQKTYRTLQSTLGIVLPKVSPNNSVVSNDKLEGSENLRKTISVSSWSVYYHNEPQTPAGLSRHGSSNSLNNSTCHLRRLSSIHCDEGSKSSNYIKKAEQVTKTLHKLYTQSSERKDKEHKTSVLDVLSKSSIEELEKALFVLRGCEAGDLIEEILKRKGRKFQHKDPGNTNDNYNKSPLSSTKTNSLSTTSNDVTISESDSNDFSIDKCESQYSLIYSRKKSDPFDTATSPESNVSSERGSGRTILSTGQKAKKAQSFLSASEFEEGDKTRFTSSTASNASDSETVTTNMRWTDIFKAPELWKRNKNAWLNKLPNTKNVSLVTLAGKRRTTMLKRR